MSACELKESLDVVLNFAQDEKETVLLVDDEENNLQLLRRTFRGKYNLLMAHNGVEALDVVKQYGDKIALIVSDQKMPVMEGTDFLKKVRETNPQIIKILLTGHVDTDILVSAINDCDLFQYILKPFEVEELKIAVENGISKYSMANNNKVFYNELRELFYKTIRAISNALDTKDSYTNGHSLRVTLYSMILAKELGLDDSYMEDIEIAGLLHDIGKIAMPKSILCKNGRLTDEEFCVMKSHTTEGEKIVINIKKLQVISEWVKSHHEKYDGTGYPDGLKGEDIPLPGRIIALADTYDAMTSTRPYRKALSHEYAMSEIKRCAGTQFDPRLTEIFVNLSDKIDDARRNPEEAYQKYSFLVKNIDFKIFSEATQES
ncbi:MAG: HD domain-containing protein [Candidatus Gastranaerophilales bacterium]|nr:HD domain-containing protein [Candidatus Gastranaerophilales bacterium]